MKYLSSVIIIIVINLLNLLILYIHTTCLKYFYFYVIYIMLCHVMLFTLVVVHYNLMFVLSVKQSKEEASVVKPDEKAVAAEREKQGKGSLP